MAENGINNYLINKHLARAGAGSPSTGENNAALFCERQAWSSLTDEQRSGLQAAAE
jgi:hypothetical protein